MIYLLTSHTGSRVGTSNLKFSVDIRTPIWYNGILNGETMTIKVEGYKEVPEETLDKIKLQGKQECHDGKSFLDNPWYPWSIRDTYYEYYAWAEGYWTERDRVDDMMYGSGIEERKQEAIRETRVQEEKKMAKTKKGRAELAGQSTLF